MQRMGKISRYYRHFTGIAFVRDILTMQSGTIVYLAATFLSSVVFARVLGVEQYGIYAVALALVGTINTFINFGQGSALLVFFSENFGKKDRAGMAAVVRNFVDVSAVCSLLLLLAAFLAPQLSVWIYDRSDIGIFSAILFLSAAIDIWNSLPIVLLQATRTVRQKVILEQSANVSFIALAILSLLLGYGIMGIVVSQLLAGCIFLPISFIVLRRSARSLALPGIRDVLHVRFAETRPYLVQGLLFSADKSIGNLFPNGLFFIMSFVTTPGIVGLCRIAMKFSTLPRTLILPQVVELSTTVLSSLKAQGIDVLRRSTATIIKHTVAIHAAMSFGALLLVPPIMYFLYGPEYAAAIPLTLWLILLSLPISLCIANSPILRLFRKIHLSIFETILKWPLIAAGFLTTHTLLGPLPAFAIAFVIANAGPLLLSGYIFHFLLPARHAR